MTPLSARELAFLFAQLHVMMHAGISLTKALETLGQDMSNAVKEKRLQQALRHMEKGKALSTAMEQTGLFPPLACRLVRAGERAGQLEEMLLLVSQYYHDWHQQRQKLRQALSYPAFLLCCTLVLLCGAVFVIVPVFADMFQELGVPLPAATQGLFSLGLWIQQYGIILLAGFVGLAALSSGLWRQPTYRLRVVQAILEIRWCRKVCIIFCWQRFSQVLAMQVRSGLPILDAMHDAAQAVRLRWFRQEMARCSRLMEQGRPLSQAVQNRKLTTPYITTMLIVGETTGTYDETLQAVAQYYTWQLNQFLYQFQQLIGPAVLLIAGIAIGVLIICLLLPLLDMAAGVGL